MVSDSTDHDDAPRLKIMLTKEGFSAVLKGVRERCVATGGGAEISRTAISGDRFRDCYCLKCGDHGALYCFEEKYVSLCSQCTVERIEKIAGAGLTLPPSVLLLYWEAEKEIEAQARREQEKLSVVFNDLFRCRRCAGLKLLKNARYWGPAEGNVRYPFCAACCEIVSSGREEFREPEQTEFDFDV